MPDHNNMSEEDKNKKGGEFRMPPRTWIVWIAIICTVVFVVLLRNNMDSRGEFLSPYQFNQLLDANLIKDGRLHLIWPQKEILNIVTNAPPQLVKEIIKKRNKRSGPFKIIYAYPEGKGQMLLTELMIKSNY